jgi:hypothetical protein
VRRQLHFEEVQSLRSSVYFARGTTHTGMMQERTKVMRVYYQMLALRTQIMRSYEKRWQNKEATLRTVKHEVWPRFLQLSLGLRSSVVL